MSLISSLICRSHQQISISQGSQLVLAYFLAWILLYLSFSSRLFWTSLIRFSRYSSSSRHTFWPSPSLVSLFSFWSCTTRHSWFSRFSSGPMGPWRPFFPFGVLLPRGPFAPVGPGYPGDLRDIPSHLTYSTWWVSVFQSVWWFLFARPV